MKTLAHLSDLHFGRIDDDIAKALAAEVKTVAADMVVVSGDFTQRARKSEFLQARSFLDTLPAPQILVPGNHDVPLYNVLARAFTPLSRYKRYITADTEPFYADKEVAVAGVNTARSLTIKGGRINHDQLARLRGRFATLPEEVIRIVVTHHPFEGAASKDDENIVGRAKLAMQEFAHSRVDLILSGHQHVNRIGSSAVQYIIAGYSALLVQAGTAISTRRRDEGNSFNVIRIQSPEIHIECREWRSAELRFVTSVTKTFRFGKSGWVHARGSSSPALVQDAGGDVVVSPVVEGHLKAAEN